MNKSANMTITTRRQEWYSKWLPRVDDQFNVEKKRFPIHGHY